MKLLLNYLMMLVFATSLFALQTDTFKYTVSNEAVTITGTVASDPTALEIPGTIDGKPVVAIGDDAFRLRWSLESVTLPSTLTTIGERAFGAALLSISIPQSVVSIGAEAFANCSRLTRICFEGEPPVVGDDAFPAVEGYYLTAKTTQWASQIADDGTWQNLTMAIWDANTGSTECFTYAVEADESITIRGLVASVTDTEIVVPAEIDGKKVLAIDDLAFSNCAALTKITLSEGIETIGAYAFNNCAALSEVVIPESLTSIGRDAFRGCDSLYIADGVTYESEAKRVVISAGEMSGDVEIPDTTWFIMDEAFGTSEITSVKLPTSIKGFGRNIFYNCVSLEAVTLPDGLEVIPQGMFYECYNLTSIDIPDSVHTIAEGAFRSCGIQSIKIPASVKTIGDYAFDGAALTTITIPDTVEYLGAYALNSCYALTSAKLPAGITEIPEGLFKYASLITTFEIPETVHTIGAYAFCGCESLTSPTIPATVTTLGDGAFMDCYNLGFVIFEGVPPATGESEAAFSSDIIGAYLPKNKDAWEAEGVITEGIWQNLTMFCLDEERDQTTLFLADVDAETGEVMITGIAEGEMHIGTFKIPATVEIDGEEKQVTAISEYAFCYRKEITEVIIPEGVTSIRAGAFSYCSSLQSVTIPESVTSIASGAFDGCTSLPVYDGFRYESEAKTVLIERVSSREGGEDDQSVATPIVIPDSVRIIGPAAFGSANITSITIPASVKVIGNYAFGECMSLFSVFFEGTPPQTDTEGTAFPPEVYTEAGSVPPAGYYRAASATAWENVITDGYWDTLQMACLSEDFENDELFTYVDNEDGTLAVSGLSDLVHVGRYEIPAKVTIDGVEKQVTSILADAFTGCTRMTELVVQQGVTTIGESAFSGCPVLTVIELPASVTTIAETAFEYVAPTILKAPFVPAGMNGWSLCELTFVEGATAIDANAFAGYSNLTTVNLPSTLESIGEYAFAWCTNLTSITLPDALETLDAYAFIGCTDLTSVSLPASLKSIGYGAFMECTSLSWYDGFCYESDAKQLLVSVDTTIDGAVTLPDSVRFIHSEAFYMCENITSITIPASVEMIGDMAISSCSSLQKVVFEGAPPTVIDEVLIVADTPVAGEYTAEHAEAWEAELTEDDLWHGLAMTKVVPVVKYADLTIADISLVKGDKEASVLYPGETATLTFTVKNQGEIAAEATTVTVSRNGTVITTSQLPALDVAATQEYTDSIAADALGYGTHTLQLAVDAENVVAESDEENNTQEVTLTVTDPIAEWLDFNVADAGVTITRMSALPEDGILEIPAVIHGLPVVAIAEAAFENCATLTEVIIPASVTTIGANAFAGCTQLKKITLPASLQTIGDGAFDGCESLPVENGFRYESDAKQLLVSVDPTISGEVTLPESVRFIYWKAFSGCTEITLINLPKSVIAIGKSAFAGCTALKRIVFEGLPPTPPEEGFLDNEGEVEGLYFDDYVADWVEVIVDGKWCGLVMIKAAADLTIADISLVKGDKEASVLYPGETATLTFTVKNQGEIAAEATTVNVSRNGTVITTSQLPALDVAATQEYTDSIAADALGYGTHTLQLAVDADNAVAESDEANNTQDVTLTVTDPIAEWLDFNVADAGVTITRMSALPEDGILEIPAVIHGLPVVAIAEAAFENCATLTEVVIPASVTTIGANAFAGCTQLTKITFLGVPPTIVGENAFSATATGLYLYANYDSWEAVIVEDKWNDLTMTIKDLLLPYVILRAKGDGEGTLTGAKSYTVGKTVTLKAKAAKGSLFAGWYTNSACTEAYADGKTDYRTTSIPFTPEGEKIYTLYGKFIPADAEKGDAENPLAITWPEEAKTDEYDAVYDADKEILPLAVTIDSLALPKVSVKGLPKGLKWNSKTFTITGTPTAPGVYTVTMTATNTKVKKGEPQEFTVRINNRDALFEGTVGDTDTVIELAAGLDVEHLDLPEALVAAIKANEAKVKGLPSGLKWNSKKGCFEGWVKTVKEGKEFYTVTFSVGKVVTTLTFKVNNQTGLEVALAPTTYTVYRGEKTELNAVSDALTVYYAGDTEHELDIENLTVKATGLPKGLSLKYNKSAQAYEITGTAKEVGTYTPTLSVTDKRLKLEQEDVAGLTIVVEEVSDELAGDFYALQEPTETDPGLYVTVNRPKGLGGKAVIETGAKKYTLSFCASLKEDTTYHAYYKKGTRISDNLPAIDLTDGKMKITLPDGTELELPYEKKVAPSSDLVRKNEPCDLTEYGFTDATLSIDKKGAVAVKAKNEANKKVTLKGVLLEDENTIYLFAKPDIFIEYSLID